MNNDKWGVCLDFNSYEWGLFQKVIQYEITKDGQNAAIVLPPVNLTLPLSKIKPLRQPPKFCYNDQVIPNNHPELIGTIISINWHFKLEGYFYSIAVNEKPKSKRYFENDLSALS